MYFLAQSGVMSRCIQISGWIHSCFLFIFLVLGYMYSGVSLGPQMEPEFFSESIIFLGDKCIGSESLQHGRNLESQEIL